MLDGDLLRHGVRLHGWRDLRVGRVLPDGADGLREHLLCGGRDVRRLVVLRDAGLRHQLLRVGDRHVRRHDVLPDGTGGLRHHVLPVRPDVPDEPRRRRDGLRATVEIVRTVDDDRETEGQPDETETETEADLDLTGRCGSCVYFIELRSRPDGIGEGECRLGCWPAPLAEIATCTQYKAYGSGWEERRRAGRPARARGREARIEAPLRRVLPKEVDLDMDMDEFRSVLRDVLREELGVGEARMGDRWAGGEMVLVPGREGTSEKRIPLESLFHKVVMIRDKLRVLEQKVNGHPKLSAEDKVGLQQYITGCYGSLTTFNVLFSDPDDRFTGQKGAD